ncbi:MAG: DUF3299 domain-containing protein [Gammaproteobacteria bacterium HGW-Gammaproteobacteria-8]|nr:MAG: DUF3299 domain-containing protein [Gammaproteobacteria bacterium HGW-Gammaproteobacteria-8]
MSPFLKFALLLTLAAGTVLAEVRELEWSELMPGDEVKAWIDRQMGVDHSGYGPSSSVFQSFTTVGELDGAQVRIPGFVVPVETTAEGLLSEFFLVPYFGACIHVPPPPANQIIYARLAKPIPMVNIWDAFWMEGTLKIEEVRNETADSAYTMDVSRLRLYE